MLCSLGRAPANGDILSVIVVDGANDLRSMTVLDSLGQQLTRRALTLNCGSLISHCVAVYDEVVSGSPSKSFALSDYNGYRTVIYDISGASLPGQYSEMATDQLLTTMTTNLASVSNGDLQICGYVSPLNSGLWLKFSNGTGLYDVAPTTSASIAHAWATSAGSATCTVGNANTGYSAGILFADYH
jgi:hypothetical protein